VFSLPLLSLAVGVPFFFARFKFEPSRVKALLTASSLDVCLGLMGRDVLLSVCLWDVMSATASSLDAALPSAPRGWNPQSASDASSRLEPHGDPQSASRAPR
jgi:hypothetical protein